MTGKHIEHRLTRNVLFLCTGNSCRSQIAEAIVNNRLTDRWKAYSAGTKPTGFVHPIVLKVLEEIDIHHNGESKHINDLPIKEFDLVITVCDDAAENCPLWLGKGERIHHSFPDPAKATGTDDEVMTIFRKARDEIEHEINHVLGSNTS